MGIFLGLCRTQLALAGVRDHFSQHIDEVLRREQRGQKRVQFVGILNHTAGNRQFGPVGPVNVAE